MKSLIVLLAGLMISSSSVANDAASLDVPDVVLSGVPFSVSVEAPDSGTYALQFGDRQSIAPSREGDRLTFAGLVSGDTGPVELSLLNNGETVSTTNVNTIAGWMSILPPLVGILIALLLRSVIPALFLGCWVGAWLLTGLTPGGLGTSLLSVFQVYVRDALANPDHAAIILFSLMIGGMVGIIFKNGGMEGIVAHSVRWAKTPRQGQLATAALGTTLFFDDYSNTLVVGNAMRPVTDRLRISREKLAFLVDATAAPIACIAVITTWVGYEVGLIDAAIGKLDGFDQSAYLVYLKSIGYSFYPLLMLLFIYLVAATERDFGPMATAERKARSGETTSHRPTVEMAEARDLKPKPGTPRRAMNGIVPIVVLVLGVLTGLVATGSGDTLLEMIGNADTYKALMWASLAAALVAGIMTRAQKILTLEEIVAAWCAGIKMMLLAMIVLILAWALGSLTEILHTAQYLVSVLGDAIPIWAVPTAVFILAAATAFSTGTSWGAMGILFPVVIPLAWAILVNNSAADPEHFHIMYSAIACVLSGAVWGDHCSPISDTTILSSMSAGCGHIDHVTTQLPYALLVGGSALALGTLPAGLGLPWWLSLIIAATGLIITFLLISKKIPADNATAD